MTNKTGIGIAGLALIAFGAFFLLKRPKDLTGGAISVQEKTQGFKPKNFASEPKFFDSPIFKLGTDAGLSPAQIFALGRRGSIQ